MTDDQKKIVNLYSIVCSMSFGALVLLTVDHFFKTFVKKDFSYFGKSADDDDTALVKRAEPFNKLGDCAIPTLFHCYA